MPNPITKKQLHRIAEIIREWPVEEKIAWTPICHASELILDYIPTRQTLSKKAILSNAYKSRKAEIKSRHDSLSSVPIPKSMPAAVDIIIRLKKENQGLKNELSMMAETAQRFIHNASLHGLSRDQLMSPLPKLSRKN